MENKLQENQSLPAPYMGTVAETLTRWQVDLNEGLTDSVVQERRAQYGENKLEEKKQESIWHKIWVQLTDVMVLILLVACIISAFTGDWIEAIVILLIVVVNTILGVLQEGKAEKALEALQKLSAPRARVLRAGKQQMVPSAELVPGDIVLLEAGDVVPADLRLIESSNLQADEASLTGESVPVLKRADWVAPSEGKLGIGDRENQVFSSTPITYGRGLGVVVSTGTQTEIGRIADRLQSIESDQTPLQKNLNQLGKILAILCVVVCLIVFAEEAWTNFTAAGIQEAFKTSIALAVAAIPEGLAAIVTIVLALGMKRMVERHAIIKRLPAVETLGCVDVICSDKTGTLTQNAMTVTDLYAGGHAYQVTGTGYEPKGDILSESGDAVTIDKSAPALHRLFLIAGLCNDAQLACEGGQYTVLGDPTEGALLTLAGKAGMTRETLRAQSPIVGDLPFDSERKRMTVFAEGLPDAPLVSLVKGAPDVMLSRCTHELNAEGEVVELTEVRTAELLGVNASYANRALRVLAFAYRAQPFSTDIEAVESNLVFAGLVGMIDPPREEAREAIAVCRQAGIRPVMITGDHRDTAAAIAKDLGLLRPQDQTLTGSELDQMTEDELLQAVDQTSVYARVSPEHKVRIVSALRAKGHVTSMTGDGVNDAPALKQADIGVAMGITGTEVAKGAADMILMDDNFATIVHAVEEGRVIYSNIRKFVGFLLSCNVGEILVIFLTTLILGLSPLDAIQLLWLNLVTDSFPALALGREKGDPDIMSHRPRGKKEAIINGEMIGAIAIQSITIFGAVFAAFYIGYHGLLQTDAPDLLVEGRTLAFATLIFSELLRAYSCRSERFSVFKIGFFSNKRMVAASLFSLVLLLVVLYVPFLQPIFHTVSLDLVHWAVIIGLGILPFAMGELYKAWMFRRNKKGKASC